MDEYAEREMQQAHCRTHGSYGKLVAPMEQ